MEVLFPKGDFDFDFNTARPPPSYLTAPPSPTRFTDSFFSAPTSPNRISEFYRELDQFSPFNDPPPKGRGAKSPGKDDFAFDSPFDSQRASLSADELFDGGKIRPSKPPTRLQIDEKSSSKTPLLSPRSPRSPISQGKKIISIVFSPRKKKDRDPFEIEVERTSVRTGENRGRDRVHDLSKNWSRRPARSLSPFRVSQNLWEEEEKQLREKTAQSPSGSKYPVSAPKSSSRKWRLRDFLLFRSASEGRAADYKNPFRKHIGLFRKSDEVKGENLQSNEGSGSVRRRRRSAHELHYTANRAAAEDSKKRTFLPYKQGILGRSAFDPTK